MLIVKKNDATKEQIEILCEVIGIMGFNRGSQGSTQSSCGILLEKIPKYLTK